MIEDLVKGIASKNATMSQEGRMSVKGSEGVGKGDRIGFETCQGFAVARKAPVHRHPSSRRFEPAEQVHLLSYTLVSNENTRAINFGRSALPPLLRVTRAAKDVAPARFRNLAMLYYP